MPKYRKKPVVDAVKFGGVGDMPELDLHMIDTDDDWQCKVCGGFGRSHGNVKTLEGYHIAYPGDYIITGVKGEHYPCKPDIFEATYVRKALTRFTKCVSAAAITQKNVTK